MREKLAALVARLLGADDGPEPYHVDPAKRPEVALAVADEIERQMTTNADPKRPAEPGADLCPGCALITLVEAAAVLAPRTEIGDGDDATAAFLGALSLAAFQEAERIRAGKRGTERRAA